MAVNDLVAGWQPSFMAVSFIMPLQRLQAPAPGETARPSLQAVTGTEGLQVTQQGAQVRVGQRIVVTVHDRFTEAGAEQGVTDVVHVDEGIDVFMVIDLPPALAKFSQGIRAAGREHQQAAGAQDTPEFAKTLVEIIAPLQGQIGDDEVTASIGERQGFHVGANEILASTPALPECATLAGNAKHGRGQIEGRDMRPWETLTEGLGQDAGAGAEVDDRSRLDADIAQSLDQLPAAGLLQDGDFIVAVRRLVEV